MLCEGSQSILKDGKTKAIKFLFPLFPFLGITFLKSLLSEGLQLNVGLQNFGIHFAFISGVHLGDGVLAISFMPFGVSANSIQSIKKNKVRNKGNNYLLSSVSSEFSFLKLSLLSLDNGMFGLVPGLLLLHFFYNLN